MLSEPALNSQTNREKAAEILFEEFNVPSMYIASSSLLALYASGRSTGIVLDSGEIQTSAIPISEGYPTGRAIQRIDFSGRELTDWLIKLLAEEGHALYSPAEREIVTGIKENLGIVELDFINSMKKKDSKKTYVLPDGQTIEVGSARFRCPEALFQPSLVGLEIVGIHTLIEQAVALSNIDARRELLANIVLAGGSTMFPGIRDRLQKELCHLIPRVKINVIAQPERKYLVWMGGAVLGSLTSFQRSWIFSKDYKESGASIINSKLNQK